MKDVYQIDDLRSRDLLDAEADLPARYAVIGKPIAHSKSPQMHQAALDALKIGARYVRIEVEVGRVGEAIRRMQVLGFVGCNVTVPHKLEVMASCTEIDPAAGTLGAVNTIHFVDGRVRGFNTDAPGFQCAIEELRGMPLAGSRVLVIGAGGGAGQAIATGCAMAGVEKLVMANRSHDKLIPLAARIGALAPAVELVVVGMEDARLPGLSRECDLIVQATSVGLREGDPSVLGEECLRPGQWVYDSIYQPPVTPLLRLAEKVGCRTANGASMLLHQGAQAFRIWHPGTEPLAWMRKGLAG